jgi:hypothetical protein
MKWAAQRVRLRICLECRQRRARFRFRGIVRADRDHTLCFRCYRSLLNSTWSGLN